MVHKLNSSWLRRATYAAGYLTLTMGERDYTYRVPSWVVGILCGWSAQGASVGSLWPKIAHHCARAEGQSSDLDLSAALAASLRRVA